MKKILLLTLCFHTCMEATFSQKSTGAIKGVVKDETGNPLPLATLMLKGTSLSTISSNLGVFAFENLNAGRYTILASFIGSESKTIEVMLKEGSTESINVILNAVSGQLQTVEVTGRTNSGYKANYSFAATKIAIPVTEIPNTVSTPEIGLPIFNKKNGNHGNKIIKIN